MSYNGLLCRAGGPVTRVQLPAPRKQKNKFNQKKNALLDCFFYYPNKAQLNYFILFFEIFFGEPQTRQFLWFRFRLLRVLQTGQIHPLLLLTNTPPVKIKWNSKSIDHNNNPFRLSESQGNSNWQRHPESSKNANVCCCDNYEHCYPTKKKPVVHSLSQHE